MRGLIVTSLIASLGAGVAAGQIQDESWSEAGYSTEIHGTSPTVRKELIRKAQQVAAPLDLVADITWPGAGCETLPLDGFADTSRWWSYCDGPFPIATTVNEDVVLYYRSIIRGFAESQQADARRPRYAKLEYRPHVSHAARYLIGSQVHYDVFVVRLSLKVRFGGGGCHVDLRKERVVVYDSEETLLDVTGDGIVGPGTVCY